jgi:hypothetical protein
MGETRYAYRILKLDGNKPHILRHRQRENVRTGLNDVK